MLHAVENQGRDNDYEVHGLAKFNTQPAGTAPWNGVGVRFPKSQPKSVTFGDCPPLPVASTQHSHGRHQRSASCHTSRSAGPALTFITELASELPDRSSDLSAPSLGHGNQHSGLSTSTASIRRLSRAKQRSLSLGSMAEFSMVMNQNRTSWRSTGASRHDDGNGRDYHLPYRNSHLTVTMAPAEPSHMELPILPPILAPSTSLGTQPATLSEPCNSQQRAPQLGTATSIGYKKCGHSMTTDLTSSPPLHHSPGALAKMLALQPGDQPIRPSSVHKERHWVSLLSHDNTQGRDGLNLISDDDRSDRDTYPQLYRQSAPSLNEATQRLGASSDGCGWRWGLRLGRRAGHWLAARRAAVVMPLTSSGAKGQWLRCILIYAITYALCLIPTVAEWIGNWTYLTVYTTLFMSTAPTVGAHLALVGRGFLGVISGALVSLLAKCTAHELDKLWDRDSPVEGYIILGLWSFVSLYVACYFRGKSDRNYVPAFLFSNVVIHCLTQDVNQYVEPIPAVWAMAKPMLLGVTLTLILGLILFPTTAMAKVERVNLNALCQILNVLDLTTKSFLLDQSTNNLAVKDLEGHIATVRKTAATLQMAVTEAQLEMSYSHHRPADFAEIPGVIHKVVQHMGSMVLSVKNEKSLLTNSSAKHMSFAKLPTTDQFSYLPVLSPRLDTTLIPSQSLLSSASKGNPSHRHLENCQFLQVLESLRPTILELAYLCELALDQCAFELITSCVTLQNPSTLYHALRSLPQQLLINSQSLLVNKHAATHTKRSTRSWINRLRGWIHCASSSPNAGDPQAPMTLSNPFAGNQQPLPRAPNSHGQSTTDDSMDLERTLTLTQLFHKSPTPSDDSSESLNSGKHSPAPCHHFRPTSKSATGSNLALSNLDEFLTRVYQALDRFDRLDTMSMLRSYHQANQLSSFESLPSINESASTDFSPAGELDSTYLHSMYPADDGEPFMIFFFLFSLRETVLLLVKLLTLMRIFKERQSARRRLWLGFVSHFWRSMTTKAFYQRPCSKSQPVTDPNINYWHANTSTLWPTPAGSSSSNHSSGPCLDTLYPPLGVWARWSSCVQWSRRHVGYWIRHQLRHVQRWYQSPQSRYAVRLSLTLVLLCVPAWHPATIATYQVHKLSWVPLTVCVVSNPTVGQTMMRSIYRITGTLLASVYVIACWYLTGGNVYAIFVCNILWALPCFYVMLFTKYRSVGLIAIIVSLVIPFLASPKASAVHTADALLGKRVWTTLLGITIAGVLSYWWWPQVARVGLRKRVASLVDTLGNLYGLLVAKLAVPPTMNPENHFFRSDPPHALPLTPSFHPTDTPTTFQASGSNQSSLEPFPVIRARHLNQQIAVGMQRAQAMLLQCSGLLDDAQVELSLQGPFPHSLYAQILTKLQNVMSRLVTMEIATNYLSPQLHATIIDPFHQYGRKDLVASLMLNFRTLADSLQNGVPLPPYLPSCQAAHSRLFSHVQAALVQEPDPKHCHHSSLVLDSSQCMGNAPHSDAPFYCESCSPTLWASPASSASNLLDHGETQTECLASPKNHSPCMHTLIPSNRSLKRFYTKYVQPRKKKIKSQRQSISLSGRHANRSQCSFKSVPSLPKVFSSKAGHMLGTFYWMAYSVAMRWVIEELDEVVDLLRQIVGENGLQAYLDPFVDETMPK